MCASISSDSYRFFVRAGVTDPDEQRQLYDLLIECDGDFVPPLSFRRSTTQAALSGSEHNPDGVRDYFNALIAQHVVLCAGNGRIVGFLSFRPEYTCDALSDGATYCYLSTMAVSHACRGQHISMNDITHVAGRQQTHVVVEQAEVTVLHSVNIHIKIQRRTHHCTDRSVHARSITARGQDCNLFLLSHVVKLSFALE